MSKSDPDSAIFMEDAVEDQVYGLGFRVSGFGFRV